MSPPPATVRYADVYGLREAKYEFLNARALDTIDWKTLDLQEPYYFFVPKDFGLQEEYEKGFKIDELMPVNNSGIQTKCDEFCLHNSEAQIRAVINDVLSLSLSDLKQKYSHIQDGPAWTLERAQVDVLRSPKAKVVRVQYKPFDFRFTYYTGNAGGFLGRPRANVGNQALHQNLFLATMRQISGTKDECVVLATETMIADRTLYSTNGTPYIFPLYLYSENMGTVERKANLNAEIVAKIAAACGRDCPNRVSFKDGSSPHDAFGTNASTSEDSTVDLDLLSRPSAEDIFHYVYGVLHTPSYRARYREFLKIDFPRIPYPKSADEFRRVASIGAELVAVHLLKDPAVTSPFANPYARLEGTGDGVVEKVAWESDPAETSGRVRINATQFFAPVPESAWNAFIGGYQPAQKWLKDRKGRALANDDLAHYKSIIAALVKTDELMRKLEGNVS